MKTEAETEKEDDYEKTEISIMEATMDNNEWITDSNQVLPWMNITVPSFSQDHKTTDQPPADDRRPGSSFTGVSRVDTEPPPPTEDKQTSSLSALDDNTEYNKKVVAVHPMPQNVNVTFSLHYLTRSPYQTVAVTGNQQELGNWKEFVPLERAKDGHWATMVSLPAESHVEWKFVLVEKGEVCRWEECGNRLLDTGSGDELTVHKGFSANRKLKASLDPRHTGTAHLRGCHRCPRGHCGCGLNAMCVYLLRLRQEIITENIITHLNLMYIECSNAE
ncbi:unnamed protein product [Pleuronectes platessa]|uniref:Starch-binding domain-containing protein 1 n=1 Tax=Pleuronectes platessa TaxID=8262 RepID=A0A9N7UK91_PLEPL|nr:unnamed protein product [Pleuronectes platessa]